MWADSLTLILCECDIPRGPASTGRRRRGKNKNVNKVKRQTDGGTGGGGKMWVKLAEDRKVWAEKSGNVRKRDPGVNQHVVDWMDC